MPGSAVNEALRILLISTDETTRKQVSDALAGRARDWRLFWVSQPDQAPTRSEGLQPQIILLDEALEDVDLDLLVQRLSFGSPEAAIVALVGEKASGAGQALPPGVQTVLSKPVTADALIPAIGQALVRSGRRPAESSGAPKGALVAFCAAGKGVGCTTVAGNTTLSLARLTSELVALIDADYAEPGVDRMLAVASDRSLADLSRSASRLERDLDSLFVTHESGARVLVAPPSGRKRKPLSRSQVQTAIAALRRVFAWSVIDLGLPHDEMGFAFLDTADLIVLTVVSEMTALRDTRLFLDLLYARGYPLSKVWVVANREGMPGTMAVEELQRWLGVRVNDAIPYSEALAGGTLAAAPGQQAELAAAFERFARMLLDERGVYLAAPEIEGAVAAMPVRAPATGIAAVVGAATLPRAASGASAATRPPTRKSRRFPVYGGFIVLLSILIAGAILLMSLRRNSGLLALNPGAPVISATVEPRQTDSGSAVVAGATPLAETNAAPTQPVGATPVAAGGAVVETPIEAPATEPVATPTLAPTETPPPSPTATVEPTLTPSPEPTATASPTVIPTETASPTAPPPTVAPRPTATRPAPTPQPTAIPAPAPPVLSAPVPEQSVNGLINFSWQSAAPLPPGVAYEVVWWNMGEDPAAARGIAPPTTENSLAANLDVLYNSGQFTSNRINWSVIAVTTDPYRRLTQPGGAGSSVFRYAATAPPPAPTDPPPAPTDPPPPKETPAASEAISRPR